MNAETTNQFFKESTISNIIMLAERIHGRSVVSTLQKYSHKSLNKLDLDSLESIRDAAIIVYNNKAKRNELHEI